MGSIFPDDRRAAERRRRRAQIRRRRITALVAAGVVVAAIAGFVLASSGGPGSAAGTSSATGTGSTLATTGSTGSTGTAVNAACPALKKPSGTAMVTYHDASGGCVKASQLVRYRCPIGTAPILRVSSGSSTRRYLGGTYALSAKKPGNATELGQVGHSVVYITPKHVVYVSEGGHLKRWLSLPASVAGSGKRGAFMLGDSVMLGAQSALVSKLSHHWEPRMNAAVSRSTPQGLDVLKSGAAGSDPAVVLQLGTNDGGTPSLYSVSVADVFNELKDTPFVVWLNIGHARSYYTEDDRIIAADAAKYPNMTVADWADDVPKNGVWSDGLHLQPAGAAAMAQLVSDYLDGWRSATFAPSAVSCTKAVDSAVA